MRDPLASGRGPARQVRRTGRVIPLPTPNVVRNRRAIRAGMALLAIALAVAVAGRIYLINQYHPSAEQTAGVSAEEAQILALVNQERAKAGRAALALSGRLSVAARGHSYDMAIRHYFSHDSADGVTAEQRLRGLGISYSEMGENIYMDNYPDRGRLAERAVRGWLGSPAHRKNMLSPNFTQSGVGMARDFDGTTYVTQDFSRE